MLTDLHRHFEFTGSVLVAQSGSVIYRDAIAATPHDARDLLTRPSNIGSVAKGFTAMAVMMLAQQGKLHFDDAIARYVPEIAAATARVTIRHLLTHTSGIPDVGDLGIDHPGVRERDVVNAVRAYHTRFAEPGRRYRYSNTGYMLLAMAVETASGVTFDRFLQTAIFEPAGMTFTRPESGTRTADETKGHGGLVSTVDDLLKWDQALATNRFVSATTFAESLRPAKVLEGETTYAFGWNVAQRNNDTYMWHTGNHEGGQRAFVGRRIGDRIAIIILTTGNSRRTEIADAIVNILHDRPYAPPRLSIARRLLTTIEADGVDAAIASYEQLRTIAATRYDFSEPELNGLGYTLLERGREEDAVRVFEINVRQFPGSSNAFDSLGDALDQSGRRADALQAYSRALEIDPDNVSAEAKLLKLNSAPRSIWIHRISIMLGSVAVLAGVGLYLSRRQRRR
jgi:CubicO group peptidase (beta-lactamase class C family)